MLFALVVLGLSATLVAKHNDGIKQNSTEHQQISGVPMVLVLATTIGVLSLVTAIFNLIIAWTEVLREHVEILVDLVVMVANVVCGTVRSHKRTRKLLSCSNQGERSFPFSSAARIVRIPASLIGLA
jgi:hypothetical protein